MQARTVAVTLALTIALPDPARAAEPPPVVEAPARSELELGLDAYGRGDYAEALVHFERSYAEVPDAATLYAWAQASRSAGQCTQAITLYQQFIDGGATGASLEAAQQNQARCREQLAAQPEPATISPPPPRPTQQVTPEPLSPPVRDRPDRGGVALLGSGAALFAVGLGVLIAALVQHRAQRTTRDYTRFDRLDGQLDGLYIGGSVALGIGAGLITGGAIRLRRNRR